MGQLLDSLLPDLSVCLDAIDNSQAKTALLAACVDRKIPVVTCGGAAGKTDPTQVQADDLTRVAGDRLLGSCRTNLRKRYGFAKGLGTNDHKNNKNKKKFPRKWGITAVYSTEIIQGTAAAAAADKKNQVSSLRRCDGALGTACFVTGTFGFVAAGKVVDMIATSQPVVPKRQSQ